MTLQPEDPKLSAWLLGELSDEEAAEVKRAVAVDPALRMAVRDLERVQNLLSNTLSPEAAALFPRQRKSVLLEARRLDEAGSGVIKGEFKPKQKVPVFFRMAAAAVLVLACWFLIQLPGVDEKPMITENPVDDALPSPSDRSTWPSPAPGDPSILLPATRTEEEENGFPALLPRRLVRPADHPSLALPMQAGHHSLAWIEHSIRKQKQLPSIHAVRLEEVLNRFPLRPVGATGISHGVSLSAEAIACPWNDDSRLLVISWRGAATASREVEATFRPDTATVAAYRLLGYARMEGAENAALSTRLEAGKVHSVIVEVVPSGPADSCGAIEWTVDGQAAPVLPLTGEIPAEATDDARFAGLVASFSLWLSGQSDAVDGRILSQMVTDLRNRDLGTERLDFLDLVGEAAALNGR